MDRYNILKKYEKEILDRLYVYFGFNEVTSFEDYVNMFFYNIKDGTSFENMFNKFLERIVIPFKMKLPEYDKYIQYYWVEYEKLNKYFEVGSAIEYDPKGVVRHFVHSYFPFLKRHFGC